MLVVVLTTESRKTLLGRLTKDRRSSTTDKGVEGRFYPILLETAGTKPERVTNDFIMVLQITR